MRDNFGGETGRVAEGEYFGYVSKEKYRSFLDNPERLQELIEQYGSETVECLDVLTEQMAPYMKTRASYELAKLLQKGSPLEPEKAFARDLRKKIVEILRLKINFLSNSSVEYYTACSDLIVKGKVIDTPADQYHSTDAFFIIKTKDLGDFIITIDGSKRPDKVSKYADSTIVWPRDLDDQENPKFFADFVNERAKEISGKLLAKYQYRKEKMALTKNIK